MIGVKKVLFTGSLMTAALFGAPSESKAIFHWFRGGGCCGTPAPVAVAPVVTPTVAAVPSCDPCQQTVAYVPQTAYRVQYVSTPVTTYRPISSCGPCGQSTTAFMPVTTFQTQAQMVPYTSYRLVYPTPAVATTSFYTPVTASYATAAAPAASSCCGGAAAAAPATYQSSYAPPATTTYSAPTTTYSAPAATPTYAAPQANAYTPPAQPSTTYAQQPAAAAPPQTYAPAPQPAQPQAAPPQTLPQTSPSDQQSLKPVPDPQTNAPAPSAAGPALTYPARTTLNNVDDRWASAPAAPTFQTVSARVNAPVADDGGWRPSR